MIRLIIADDHDLVRSSIAFALQINDDLAVVGEAGTGVEAIAQVDALEPDVVLMDLKMPVMDGITATRLILKSHPEIKVIALTSTDHDHLRERAIEAGVSRCLFKNTSIDQLYSEIKMVAGD